MTQLVPPVRRRARAAFLIAVACALFAFLGMLALLYFWPYPPYSHALTGEAPWTFAPLLLAPAGAGVLGGAAAFVALDDALPPRLTLLVAVVARLSPVIGAATLALRGVSAPVTLALFGLGVGMIPVYPLAHGRWRAAWRDPTR